jgi:hypothetical protein
MQYNTTFILDRRLFIKMHLMQTYQINEIRCNKTDVDSYFQKYITLRKTESSLLWRWCNIVTASVVKWSGFLTTEPEARVRFPALPEKKVVGLERGPLSLVSTTEELLE